MNHIVGGVVRLSSLSSIRNSLSRVAKHSRTSPMLTGGFLFASLVLILSDAVICVSVLYIRIVRQVKLSVVHIKKPAEAGLWGGVVTYCGISGLAKVT